MFNTNPDRPTEEILQDINQSAINAFNNKNTALVIAPFAALLVKLSREADRTSDKNIRLQNGVILLTVLVLTVACAQPWGAYMQLTQSRMPIPQQTETKDYSREDTQQSNAIRSQESNAPPITTPSAIPEPQESVQSKTDHSLVEHEGYP